MLGGESSIAGVCAVGRGRIFGCGEEELGFSVVMAAVSHRRASVSHKTSGRPALGILHPTFLGEPPNGV